MIDCGSTFGTVAGFVGGGTYLRVNFGHNYRRGRIRTDSCVGTVVAAAVVADLCQHLGDCPEGSTETATCSGISGPNVAPSPITYHP